MCEFFPFTAHINVTDRRQPDIDRMEEQFAELFDRNITDQEDEGDEERRRLVYNLDNEEELYGAFCHFKYGACPLFSTDELLQIMLYKIKIDGNVSQGIHQQYCDIINSFTNSGYSPDRRTVEKMLDTETGITQNRFDACSTGCCAYTGDLSECTECPVCQKARVLEVGRKSTYDYIEFIHRIRLWYSEPDRAQDLQSYHQQLGNVNTMSDVWDGKLVKKLRSEGLLVNDTDLAFSFATDGVELFRKGKPHSVWPLMLTCLNLPPESRFMEENVLFLGM